MTVVARGSTTLRGGGGERVEASIIRRVTAEAVESPERENDRIALEMVPCSKAELPSHGDDCRRALLGLRDFPLPLVEDAGLRKEGLTPRDAADVPKPASCSPWRSAPAAAPR